MHKRIYLKTTKWNVFKSFDILKLLALMARLNETIIVRGSRDHEMAYLGECSAVKRFLCYALKVTRQHSIISDKFLFCSSCICSRGYKVAFCSDQQTTHNDVSGDPRLSWAIFSVGMLVGGVGKCEARFLTWEKNCTRLSRFSSTSQPSQKNMTIVWVHITVFLHCQKHSISIWNWRS